MARTALISDIHGNYDGFQTTLEDIEEQDCDRIICLGDLVDGGPADVEVVREIREMGLVTVRGNHDALNPLSLPRDVHDFLQNLPEDHSEGDVLYTHITPRDVKRNIDTPEEAWNAFNECDWRLVFHGHRHVPHIFGESGGKACRATEYTFEYNQPFLIDPSERYLIGIGAIAYGRDGIQKIRYAIYDDAGETVEMRAIKGPLLDIAMPNIYW